MHIYSTLRTVYRHHSTQGLASEAMSHTQLFDLNSQNNHVMSTNYSVGSKGIVK